MTITLAILLAAATIIIGIMAGIITALYILLNNMDIDNYRMASRIEKLHNQLSRETNPIVHEMLEAEISALISAMR